MLHITTLYGGYMYQIKDSLKVKRHTVEERFIYNRETGTLLHARSKKKVPTKLQRSGYLTIEYGGRSIMVHRLVWFMETFSKPDIIKHKNGDKTDNRFENLEPQTFSEALQETAKYRKPGAKGYCFNPGYGDRPSKYMAHLSIRGEMIKLGFFDTPEEAHNAYAAFIADHS